MTTSRIFAPMREHVTKVRYSTQWQRPLITVLLLILGSWLVACSTSKVNYRNGRYYSARDMARMKAADRRRGAAPAVVKSKVKTSTPAGRTKTVARRPAAPAARPLPANVPRQMAVVIETARSFQGTPYKFGGTSRLGMDCSGLLLESFAAINVAIPRSSNEQALWGEQIRPQELRPGDLVFFGASPGSSTITHVGLITEASAESVQFIHSSSSLGVVENALETDYYLSRFIKAVRPRL
ncbi:cell wall-associated NlpC family hydrolase [Hymenobacter luteus]|uniref:Cell wall-associated NlpC family hydrolase n=2 Tax=Hymenobacter TaxID=89966 RepID=A0A7W9T0I2_9BACT|nr:MULTISPECIES: NlpC/P60 family protein [Hymenobacter]MBB4600593.1 cell wall-associated NlpC family hydrolase [Hymenobacter latericoloratus]MBB6059200.1 cell wall-associated NlpC family hydrolase [Hymenobacter luteus]